VRFLKKCQIPAVLAENAERWLADYAADPDNSTKRYRYRNAEIKAAIRNETGWKCAYCESKIGHNTPGDVEHKVPTAKSQDLHFSWANLTCACGECNRRKGDYYEQETEFIDPYVDDSKNLYGTLVRFRAGDRDTREQKRR
jgi:uncharacterized protein (TIGR02646 family)